MGALRWNERDAQSPAGNWADPRGLLLIADLKSRNMAATRLDRRRAAETCAEQVLRPPAEIQARIGHRTRVWEAENKTASSRTYTDSYPYADRTIRT